MVFEPINDINTFLIMSKNELLTELDKIMIQLRHTPPTTRRNIRDRFILQRERVKLMHKLENLNQ